MNKQVDTHKRIIKCYGFVVKMMNVKERLKEKRTNLIISLSF